AGCLAVCRYRHVDIVRVACCTMRGQYLFSPGWYWVWHEGVRGWWASLCHWHKLDIRGEELASRVHDHGVRAHISSF
ncbi:hypothetical protein KKH23_08985, partial [Patescibacteria group bacterium]|nr:hypothetical protein [Patescibacteria group bacterium]